MLQKKPVFVISDLHIGDCSPRDNLCQANREALLDSFLDHVDQQEGQLTIIGDFFELLGYPLDRVIARRRRLLDRLARMEALYVPGNHDEDTAKLMNVGVVAHPFFARMSHAFTRRIGDRRFRFMHGHEVDPFISPGVQSIGRMIGSVAYFLESRQGACILSNDAVTGALLEAGEQLLRLWARFRGSINRAIHECYDIMPAEKVTLLARGVRTRRMLARYYADKAKGLYDVAVVGHTHKAGTFSDWYVNSGSWTGRTNDFLKITPDGEVGVFGWSEHGPRPNNTVVQP